ncbi:MAG: glycosyltransferase 87 family protein, partial [Saprospiraceae bacterium]
MQDFWKKTGFIGLVYTLAAIVVSVQKLAAGQLANGYTAYENYLIFKTSFGQLAANANPYAGIPDGPWDLFKYSPAFALGMAPFSALPDWLGLSLWNLLNALPLLYALLRLPVLSRSQRVFCCWIVLPELITSLQNSQSNGLTAAAILLAFLAFEQQQPIRAAGWVAASAFIKIFGIFAAVPAWLYPRQLTFAGWLCLWSVVLFFMPLLLVSPLHLAQVYAWWAQLLWADQAVSVGLSVQGWLQTWFGWEPSKTLVTLAGLFIFVASVLAARRAAQQEAVYRILAWASLLLWVVIFNHKAESPTYIIAMCGAALWFCSSEKKTWEKLLF